MSLLKDRRNLVIHCFFFPSPLPFVTSPVMSVGGPTSNCNHWLAGTAKTLHKARAISPLRYIGEGRIQRNSVWWGTLRISAPLATRIPPPPFSLSSYILFRDFLKFWVCGIIVVCTGWVCVGGGGCASVSGAKELIHHHRAF